jgi:RsiW-degrading membrane proteinase PrsW (M82 family)
MPRTYIVGRDPACDIRLADDSVSRRHAELLLLDDGRLEVRDLGSTRGTSVRRSGQPVSVGGEPVDVGEEVTFGELSVPLETLIDMVSSSDGVAAALLHGRREAVKPPPPPPPSPVERPEDFERVLPMARGRAGLRRLWERNLILPPLATVAVFMLLLHGLQPWGSQHATDYQRLVASIDVMNELGVILTLAAFYAVYRLCGKRKSFLVLLAVAAAEYVIFEYADEPYMFVFRTMTKFDSLRESSNPISLFVAFFFGAGLMEELMKMTPALVVIAVVKRLKPAARSRWDVIEPLDAILYAAAAASMFIILETLGQYVPRSVVHGLWNPQAFATLFQRAPDVAAEVIAAFPALQKYIEHPNTWPPLDLLLAVFGAYPKLVDALGVPLGEVAFRSTLLSLMRTVQALSGHIAYSVYFGYFVGLAVMRPDRRKRLFFTGWLGAAVIHAAYDALPEIVGSSIMAGLMSAVAVFFLVVVIAAARKISPTRAKNFATVQMSRTGIGSGTTSV